MGRIEDELKRKTKAVKELQAEYDKTLMECIKGLDNAILSLMEMRNEVLKETNEKLDSIRNKANEQ